MVLKFNQNLFATYRKNEKFKSFSTNYCPTDKYEQDYSMRLWLPLPVIRPGKV